MKIPSLQLSLGQVAWVLAMGHSPQQHLLDKLNYLRQLGIPFSRGARDARQPGSGNHLPYTYDELVECGVAVHALIVGMKPADISRIIVEQRPLMRKLYRRALREQPDAALDHPWVRSRGKIMAVQSKAIFLRLHDRYADKPGTMDVVSIDESLSSNLAMLFDPVEQLAGGQSARLVPLTRLVLQWTAWAREAPAVPRGRPGSRALNQP